MRKTIPLALACALLAAGRVPASADSDAPAKPHKQKAQASDVDDSGIDRKHFEKYLEGRIAKIDAAQTARLKFFVQEDSDWKAFWDKVVKERKKFEIRMTRQTVDLFDALASLDPKDHAQTIANFEKMQNDFMKDFDQQQKQRIQDFFASHQQRWSDFAADQEKERADFMAEAQQGWQDNKATLMGNVDPQASDDEAKPKPAKKPHHNSALNSSNASNSDSGWH